MARILVVDDSRLAYTALKQLLERAGHQVMVADGAAKGIEMAAHESVDCITTDILMPGMDGRELLDALRAKGMGIPVIVVTADIQQTTRADCLRRGAYAVIDKPPKGQDLLKAIDSAIAASPRIRRQALTSDQLDALGEFVNVGVGRAGGALNDLVSSHVELSVPQVQVLTIEELPGALGGIEQETVSSVQMTFRGGLDGSAFLIFPQPSALKLVALLTGDESRPEDFDSIRSGTLTEIGNILINSVVGTLSNILERPLQYSLPVYAEEPVVGLLTARHRQEHPMIVLAKTNFIIRQMEIEGNLLLLFELKSFDNLLTAIQSGWGER